MRILPIILLLISLNTFSQSDTIFLQQIVVKGKQKEKYRQLKSKGPTVSFGNNLVDGFLTRFNNVPAGTLSSITLYFNAGLINLVTNNANRNAVDFKLLINRSEEDGSLGSSLYENEVLFRIEKEHRGEITLDIRSLSIRTSSQMYFGIETIEKANTGSFTVMMERNPETQAYIKMNGTNDWTRSLSDFQIKLKANILE